MTSMLPIRTNGTGTNRLAGMFTDTPPFALLDEMRREMDRVFDQAIGTSRDPMVAPRLDMPARTWTPAMDVAETDREFRLSVEVPGLSPDDLNVEVTDDVLRITGEKKLERDAQHGGYRLVERRAGRFERRLALPSDVDAEHVTAEYEHGVLTVTVPKRADAKKARRVEIKSSVFQKLLGRNENKDADEHATERSAKRADVAATAAPVA